MSQPIWLSFAGKQWLESSVDEKGTLDVFSLATWTHLKPDKLTVGNIRMRDGITIEVIRSFLGPKAGTTRLNALPVDGEALPRSVESGWPSIWLSFAGKQWLESSIDEKGTLDVFSLATWTHLKLDKLTVGKFHVREGITIEVIRSFLGPKAGTAEEFALPVDGEALSLSVESEWPSIWLSFAGKQWLQSSIDEKGTLDVFSLATWTRFKPDKLTVGNVRMHEGVTIEVIRSFLGPKAGTTRLNVLRVDGEALPRSVESGWPSIWLSFAGKQWLESSIDEKGTLDVFSLATWTHLKLDKLTVGKFHVREGITIEVIRSFLGPKAGTAEEFALPVDGEALPPDEIQDRSEDWVKVMLLAEPPELPPNLAGLEMLLFPEQHRKLPVSTETYKNVAVEMPEFAAKFLIEADGSRLPGAVGTFLLEHPGLIVTEIETTLLVAGSLSLFFKLFKRYVRFSEVTLSFNSTEKARNSYSRTIEPRKRPDTIATASGCTLLVGEDKVGNLHAAEGDLRSKMRQLNPMFYGELKFILGYIAAGTKFQWIYIGRNGPKELYRVGRPLDLLNILDRCYFLLSVGSAFQLLMKMHGSIPAVPGRRAMFSMEDSPDGMRTIYFYDDKVAKLIRDFPSYSADQGTNITMVKRAYVAARTCRFLPQTVSEPIETARGSYRVEFGPLGYQCILQSEEECRWMAQRVCQALCTLHREGLVHRDIRLPNIVRLSDTDFMLIDLESVADSPFVLFDGFKPFSGWYPEMYEGNQYTPFSDMYSVGRLLDAGLPGARTARAEDFIRKLTDKQLSSSQALQHPWLSELMLKEF